MKRGLPAALLMATCASTVLAQSAAAASPNERVATSPTLGIRLLAPTGTPSSNPLASSYIVARLAPGEVLSRTVEIDDRSETSMNVALYVAAAKVVAGQFEFAARGASNDLTNWTSIASSSIRLAPESDAVDTVTTRVPDDASAGTLYAVIWAAVSAAPARGSGITLVSRVGVRMYVSVGPGGAAPSNFALRALSAKRESSGDSLLVTTVHNSGANTLDLDGHLTLTHGPGGLHAGPFVARLGVVLAPGATEPASVILAPDFPRGPWTATLRVSSGTLSRSTSDTITFPARPAIRTPSGVALPLSLALIALLVGASFWFTISRRRRNSLNTSGRAT
jgi:hypothetical protein